MKLALVVIAWIGCASEPALMVRAPAPAPDPGHAQIVFVHHAEPRVASCAPGELCAMAPPRAEYLGSPTVRIVDETGRFIGDSAPGTAFTSVFAPGSHMFVGWIGDRLDSIVLSASVEAGRTYYVEVRGATVGRRMSCHGSCSWSASTAWFHPLHSRDLVEPWRIIGDIRWTAPDDDLAQAVIGGRFDVLARIHRARGAAAEHVEPDDGY